MVCKNKCSLCFVILHYLAIESTIRTVDSIKKTCDIQDYKIIIVDNCSPNNSGSKLSSIFEKDPKVIVIHNNINLGFSSGNNIGIDYARDEINAEFIAVCNNDIIFLDENIYLHLKEDYRQFNFAVAGPQIFQKNDEKGTQNPVESNEYSENVLKKTYNNLKILYALSFLHADEKIIAYRKRIKDCPKTEKTEKNIDYYNSIQVDIMLHGSCWFLSPLYLEKLRRLDEYTFMFGEELVLYKQVKQAGLTMMYDPRIKILHEHMVASNLVSKSSAKNRRIRYKRQIISTKILLGKYKETWK